MSARRQQGFTLIEVMVASVIFAIVMSIAFMSIRGAARQRDRVAESLERFHELQRAVQIFTRDLSQLQPRAVRDLVGNDRLPALITGADGAGVEFTSGGWSNPAGLRRSVLQRVGYEIEDDVLYRSRWPVLDRTQATVPDRRELLTGITAMSMRFFDAGGEPVSQWPPLGGGATSGPGGAEFAALPVAVEFTFELEDHGLITRLIEVAR